MLVLRLNYCLIWVRAWLCTITTLLISSHTLLLYIHCYKICVQLQIRPEIKICQTELDNSSSSRTIMWNKVDSKHCVLIPGSVSHQNSARFSLEIVGLTFSYQSSNITPRYGMKLRNYILRKFGDNGCAVWVLVTRMIPFDCMGYAGV